MAIVIFKSKNSTIKPKKEYIDLSIEHKKAKKSSQLFKIAFGLSFVLNICLFVYLYINK